MYSPFCVTAKVTIKKFRNDKFIVERLQINNFLKVDIPFPKNYKSKF
jgi:hypothetical protein